MRGHLDREEARFRRAHALFAVIVLLSLVAAARLFDLQVMGGEQNRLAADQNRYRKEVLRARRGRILDRTGQLLADNFASFVVTLNPHDQRLRRAPELGRVIGHLAGTLERDSTAIANHVGRARRQTFLPVRIAQNLTQPEVARIEETDLPGVGIRVEPLRRYPHGALAAHVLGYVGEIDRARYVERRELGYEADDQVGKSAIEERYDTVLHGRNGVRYLEVDAFGRAREFSTGREPEHPEHGSDVVLTIDLELQRALESALDASAEVLSGGLAARGGRAVGAAVAMDVWTGEVLALVSRPTFDPNRFAVGHDRASWESLLRDPDKPLLDRAIQSRYPPGSVFKLAVAAAAMDSGLVVPTTTLRPCHGIFPFGTRSFRCWKAYGHGSLTLSGAIEQSCDVYFYQLGEMLGVDGIARYARRFRLANLTGIELGGEAHGLVPDSRYLTERYGRRGWSGGAALNLAIGQGELLTTPLALAAFIGSIVNGGDRVVPHLVRAVVDPSGVRRTIPVPPRAPVVRELGRSLERVRNMMVRVVEGENGTGRRAAVEGLGVAGKTGTSQNSHGLDHALFASFAPADVPHLTLVVVLEQRGHGGEIAAPLAAAFWEAYARWRERIDAEDVVG